MSYGDGGTYVVLADSLKAGLDALVTLGKNQPGGSGTSPPPTTGGTNPSTSPSTPPSSPATPPPQLTPALAQAANNLDAAIAAVTVAQKSGDPLAYGQALKNLDTAMRAFQAASGATGPTPKAGPTTPAPTPSS